MGEVELCTWRCACQSENKERSKINFDVARKIVWFNFFSYRCQGRIECRKSSQKESIKQNHKSITACEFLALSHLILVVRYTTPARTIRTGAAALSPKGSLHWGLGRGDEMTLTLFSSLAPRLEFDSTSTTSSPSNFPHFCILERAVLPKPSHPHSITTKLI